MISFINSVPGSTADQQKVTGLQDEPLSKLTYVDVENHLHSTAVIICFQSKYCTIIGPKMGLISWFNVQSIVEDDLDKN